MKLIKSRTLRFVTGKFEHAEISATVEVDTDELDHTHQGAVKYANGILDQLMAEDVDRIAASTPEDEAFVFDWKEVTTNGTNR